MSAMADSDAILDVSAVLEQLLTDAMLGLTPALQPVAKVHDLKDTVPTAPPLLTLFLYEICEDPGVRNRPEQREPDATGGYQLRKAPMALLLRYLVSAWAGDIKTELRMLGRVLQVLYDRPTLSGAMLTGSLAGSDDALQVTLAALTLEEKARVWYSIQKPYKLSLNYEVRVANLDAEVTRAARPVTRRDLEPAVREGVAP
jgi:hypothetical protein